MKRIYVCASFRDLEVTERVAEALERADVPVLISRPGDPRGIAGCLERIDRADLLYVSNPRGEIGKSVSLDLGYAIARGKPIYSLLPVSDPPISEWISGPIDVAQLVELARR